ncbi:DNA/RNA non-specific endonuclease [Maricaulaceae bacterium NA33B04]|nr:DNA/RNA non-specific endonuclease [Maricaulaceae bacterium NA33B04]
MSKFAGYDGYKPDFLKPGLEIPLPKFTLPLRSDVLETPELREGTYADYIYYTLAMSREFRAPLFTALNIDQINKHAAKRSSNWYLDDRVGAENQLGQEYYYKNDWDRGHLAMKHAAAHGDSARKAQQASDSTFFYTNAALQHERFNQDEWLALEQWVLNFKGARDGRVCEFSGPIFGEHMRTVRPTDRTLIRQPGYVPTAFFKVIAFLNTDDDLEVRAFVIFQDEQSMADHSGRKTFNNQIYQVSVAEVERLTGLEFPDELAKVNPIWFNDSESARRVKNVTSFPERRDINGEEDIITAEMQDRPNDYRDDEVEIYIAGAMVNPEGRDADGEWVSLLNLSGHAIQVKGWQLLDRNRNAFTITQNEIAPGEAIRVDTGGSGFQLVNAPEEDRPGLIILNDENGDQIDRVNYRKGDVPPEGKVLIFAYTYGD